MAGNCGSACPVDEGFYSYQPSISGNAAFVVIFGLLFVATLFLGWRFRNLRYSALLSASHLLQILAFVGRVLLHRARDSQPYFLIFLLGTLLAPLFAAGTIISAWSSILAVGTTQSPFLGRRAVLHVGMLALLLSVLGLELAGAVLLCYGQTVQLQTNSIFAVIAGLAVQTFSIVLMFGLCVVALYHGSKGARDHLLSTHGDLFLGKNGRGLEVVGVALLAHSVYRIVEMALGISGTLFQSETAFMVANGALPFIYCTLLTVLHPKNAARSSSTVTPPPASEKRKARPPPLAHDDSHPESTGCSTHPGLQVSPTSPASHSSNAPEMESGSPGLPANPRPTQKSTPSPTAAEAHGSKPALSQNSTRQNRFWKRERVTHEMVEADDLW